MLFYLKHPTKEKTIGITKVNFIEDPWRVPIIPVVVTIVEI